MLETLSQRGELFYKDDHSEGRGRKSRIKEVEVWQKRLL